MAQRTTGSEFRTAEPNYRASAYQYIQFSKKIPKEEQVNLAVRQTSSLSEIYDSTDCETN